MKTPLQMLIDIASEMTDAAITLELIYRNTDNTCETDSGITCVVRSLLRTNDKAQEYIEQLSDASAPPPPNRKRVNAILLMTFFTRPLRQENSKSLHMFIMRFTSLMRMTASPQCIWHQRFSTMQ